MSVIVKSNENLFDMFKKAKRSLNQSKKIFIILFCDFI